MKGRQRTYLIVYAKERNELNAKECEDGMR